MDDIKIYKSQLRQKKILERRLLEANVKQNLDNTIFNNLISCKEYISADVLLCYASKEIEVDTWNIIEYALKDKKIVLLPRCNTEKTELIFCKIDSLNNLHKSIYDIFEPNFSCEIFNNYKNSVCIVPGLSFDTSGTRLGFGKGYYDRFLKDYSGCKIGLCYYQDIDKSLPKDVFDIPVDIIITENKKYYI